MSSIGCCVVELDCTSEIMQPSGSCDQVGHVTRYISHVTTWGSVGNRSSVTTTRWEWDLVVVPVVLTGNGTLSWYLLY